MKIYLKAQFKSAKKSLDGVQLGGDQKRAIRQHFRTEGEEFDQGTKKWTALALNVPDAAQALEKNIQSATFSHDVCQFVSLLVVSRTLMFIVETFDEFFRGISQQASHAVDDPHWLRFVVFGQEDLTQKFW